jgi:hypothetical protein
MSTCAWSVSVPPCERGILTNVLYYLAGLVSRFRDAQSSMEELTKGSDEVRASINPDGYVCEVPFQVVLLIFYIAPWRRLQSAPNDLSIISSGLDLWFQPGEKWMVCATESSNACLHC